MKHLREKIQSFSMFAMTHYVAVNICINCSFLHLY